MALGDIFELKHAWEDNDGRKGENVWFYRYTALRGLGVDTDEESLAITWIDAVLAVMNVTIPNTYRSTGVTVRNLFDSSVVWVEPLSLLGGRSGAGSELMPQFNALKVTLSHKSGLIKKGRRMFGGFFESDQLNGLLTGVAMSTLAIKAALALLDIVDSATLGIKSFRPVVVKRVPIEFPIGTIIGYRLPENSGEAEYSYIESAVMSPVITSQNTRKD
jgi:hypothetical protein